MDATYYQDRQNQYTTEKISRELIKAYTSFRLPRSMNDFRYGIATGNWGCGAFNGDRHLKGIICQ